MACVPALIQIIQASRLDKDNHPGEDAHAMNGENIPDHRRTIGGFGGSGPTFCRNYLVIWPLGRLIPLPHLALL